MTRVCECMCMCVWCAKLIGMHNYSPPPVFNDYYHIPKERTNVRGEQSFALLLLVVVDDVNNDVGAYFINARLTLFFTSELA